MERKDPPEAYGVFKPVGHVVLSFASEAQLQAALDALGSVPGDKEGARIARYTPAQMLAQADADVRSASPLASVGQEMNLVKAHRELAERGHGFLVVPVADDAAVRDVARIAREAGAYTAQHYGRFVIEELIDRTPGRTQAFESPDRGLDMAVPGEGGRRGTT